MPLIIQKIEITDIPDIQGEIEITMTDRINDLHYQYINEQEAQQIIDHLTAVFDLGNPNTPDSSEEG